MPKHYEQCGKSCDGIDADKIHTFNPSMEDFCGGSVYYSSRHDGLVPLAGLEK